MTPSETPREPAGSFVPLAPPSGIVVSLDKSFFEQYQINLEEYAVKWLGRSMSRVLSSSRGWGPSIQETTEAVQRLFPEEPGELATKWLEVSIHEDGQDYVYDECMETIQECKYDLRSYDGPFKHSDWKSMVKLQKKIELCEWILRHELMNSIPL